MEMERDSPVESSHFSIPTLSPLMTGFIARGGKCTACFNLEPESFTSGNTCDEASTRTGKQRSSFGASVPTDQRESGAFFDDGESPDRTRGRALPLRRP